jgi:3-oxoacyl-[acyl-carrier protein] reductase
MRDMSNQTVLVTGGARGIGREYARHFADLGANVAVADIDLAAYEEFEREAEEIEAEEIEAEIGARGAEGYAIETDITDPEQVAAMAEAVYDRFGRIDALIANAGGGDGPFDDTFASSIEYEYLHSTVEKNLYGTVYSCVEVAPYMKKQESGDIVTIASRAGREAREDGSYAHYGAAKAGIIMYTKYLAQDLGEHGINANCIAPGPIKTGRIVQKIDESANDSIEDREEAVPIGRLGTPEDCAKAAEFLISDDADYITGAVIPADGGIVRGL